MKPETMKQLQHLMNEYRRSGAKNYRRKQYERLVFMLNDIIQHEQIRGNELQQLGRKHVIGFWRRHDDWSQQTRKEYWQVLNVFYQRLGRFEPPKPKSKNL